MPISCAEVISDLGLRDVTCRGVQGRAVERQVRLHHRPSGGSARQIVRHGVASGPQSETKWVLPKGESAKSELDEAMRTWQGRFSLVPSRTHPASSIVIAEHVERKGKR